LALAAAALACRPLAAVSAEPDKRQVSVPAILPGSGSAVETVRFADPRWPAVRLVRGSPNRTAPPPTVAAAAPPLRQTAANREIVTFGDGRGTTVAVVRGTDVASAEAPSGPGSQPGRGRGETVSFANPRSPLVSILRGSVTPDPGIELFGSAAGGELDRVAFAVDGVESGHGANLAMWRPELDGPQGPMQVSAAAALDVGGGDRFDLRQNRLIGRAYLATMYRRYGNWPDAIAAYNWGPGNLDQWIAAGRLADRLPLETARYLLRVLHDAFLSATP